MLSAKNSSAGVSVWIDRKPGHMDIRTTYAPQKDVSRSNGMETVWYDDDCGILRLRRASTGEEYDLTKAAILEHNMNRPGAVASEGEPVPDWFPMYPGAYRPKDKINVWGMTATATFATRDSIRQVYDFYKTALPRAGATIVSSNFMRSGRPSRDFSGSLKAQRGNDVVEISVGEIVHVMTFGPTPPKRTGIGVRYTVPLQ